jgi:MarR family transcriptional regulator for hemolysin
MPRTDMPRQTDPDTFGFLITDVSRLLRAEFDRRIADAGIGLTPGEGRTLSYAARAGVVRQMVLAERMGIEAMTLSTFLDKLEARGLIERRADPTDRRAKLVHLTEAAAEVLEQVQAIGARLREDVAREIPRGEWERLNGALRAARDSLCRLRSDAAQRESDAA